MKYNAGTVESKKQVGFLSEVSYYYPFMEVGKLLDFYCSFYEIPYNERKKRIEKVLAMVGLQDKINAKMSELSKGMQQRFGIAQAIIADPPLLILDELTSGLDPIAQKEVKDIIIMLKQQGKTIFFSSHQMTEVEMICDKIGIIYNGKMLKSANLDDFIREESGALSKVVIETEDSDSLNFLKERNITLSGVKKDVYSFIIPDNGVNSIVDEIREKKISLLEVSPHRYSLEDAFFKLIKEAS
jgi:ABC-2 type transport system ATP-binding protein